MFFVMSHERTTQGVYFALTAYAFWGIVPIYFKWVDHVSPWEILAHRVVWALVLLICILAYTGELKELKVPVAKLPKLFLTAVLLTVNWLVFIYAVVNQNITETSLGYFINPLVSVFLAVIFLKEGLRPLQWIAIVVAGTGIAIQLILFGRIPWLALTLAFSFGFYGLLRKNLGLHAIAGLAIETIIIAPFALAYIAWIAYRQTMTFGNDIDIDLLLMLGGFVTSFPLLCFAAAVTRLPLTVMGMFQYIAPTISLIIAVLVYNEEFGIDRLVTFGCIWFALLIFTVEAWIHHKQHAPAPAPDSD
jgi:chloramphenicol-sensitive protein RarD